MSDAPMMNRRLSILFAWAGPAFVVLLLLAFFAMNFLPPLAPTDTAAELTAFFEAHRTGIRLGATLIMQMCILGVLWSAAIATQIRRIETTGPPILTYSQLLLGLVTFFVLIFPCIMWTVAAFRPERDSELLLMLNDLAWLALLMPVFSGTLQALVIGLAILQDRRPEPLYPRWAAYLNFWCALLFLPGALATFFKTGPFAWNGLFDFWVPVVAFMSWILVMGVLTARAIRRADD